MEKKEDLSNPVIKQIKETEKTGQSTSKDTKTKPEK